MKDFSWRAWFLGMAIIIPGVILYIIPNKPWWLTLLLVGIIATIIGLFKWWTKNSPIVIEEDEIENK